MSLTFAKQMKRTKVLSRAACVEDLENRMLMSTYYVSNSGSDSAAGALGTPWATLQKAIHTAQSGDTVILRGGSYSGGVSITQSNFTLEGMAGEVAKVSSPINNSSIMVNISISEDASHVTLNNLDLSGGYWYTVKTQSTWDTGVSNPHGSQYLTIENCKLHDTGQDIVKLTPATNYALIQNCEIYNSGRRDASNAEGIDAVQANYATVRDSIIHDTTTNGIYFKGGSQGTMIERNKVYNIGYSGILLGQSSDYNWFDVNANPYYYENLAGTVRDNLVYNTQGAGIGAWAAWRPQIYNNTCINVAQSMFSGLLIQSQEQWPDKGPLAGQDVYVPSTDVTMYNNIVEVDSSRPAFSIRTGGLTGSLTMSNNIYYQNGKAAQISDDVHGYYGNLAGWQAKGYDQGSMDINPQVNAAASYQLNSNSPAINTGKTAPMNYDYGMNSRPSGGAYDIGAWEFGGTPTAAAPVASAWNNRGFAAQRGQFNVVVAVTPSQANGTTLLGVSSGAPLAATSLAPIVRFNANGTIDVRNGANFGADVTMPYKAGITYFVKFVINMATKTYDVYVMPGGGGPGTKIANGYHFRTEQASAGVLSNFASYNVRGYAAVDLVRVGPPIIA